MKYNNWGNVDFSIGGPQVFKVSLASCAIFQTRKYEENLFIDFFPGIFGRFSDYK